VKTRRRFVEVAKSVHCHIGRAEATEHVERAVRAAGDSSKIEITRRGGCVTIRTLEQQDVLDAHQPDRGGSSPAPLAASVMTLEGAQEPKD
jgi:hypothetical protein